MASTHSVFIFTFLSIVAVSHTRVLDDVKDKPDPDLMFCGRIAIGIQECYSIYDFPYCNGTKSQLEQCTDKFVSVFTECKIPLITEALKFRTHIFSTSDEVLCKDQLYKKFESNTNCWRLAKIEMSALSGLVQDLLTDDSCEFAKMNVDIFIGLGYSYPGCPELLKSYFAPIYNKTACA